MLIILVMCLFSVMSLVEFAALSCPPVLSLSLIDLAAHELAADAAVSHGRTLSLS